MSIAVLIPCYNEERTVGKVVEDFRHALPQARIYVYDNASEDATSEVAKAAGAEVRVEANRGKGRVVRRMFREISADYYVLVDGDDTYEASISPAMLQLAIENHLDLVNGIRIAEQQEAYRAGHRWGNRLLTGLVSRLFGKPVNDMLSGYKVLSRRFVKSFSLQSHGFDLETELTVHALELDLPTGEIPGPYRSRPDGSESKLSTWRDGWRILWRITDLLRHERPLLFFGSLAVLLATISLGLGIPVIVSYLKTGMVLRFPTAFLAMGIMLTAVLSLMTGLILDTVSRGRKEIKILAYQNSR